MTLPNQDFIVLNGLKSPGRARITGASDPRKWDKRQGYGFSGAFLVYVGDELPSFSVMIDLVKPADFIAWATFAPLLEKPKKGVRPTKALSIQHPLLRLAPLNITEAVVEDVSQFEVDDDGVYTCEIKFAKWGKPAPVLAKPTAAIPGVAAKVPVAKDAGEAAILSLLAQRNALAAQAAGAP
jgi:hypothetical protein